ncbi:cilia- and flagella-associated protein 95 isoform X2 [Pelodiscus sinensis]|uniref:cilia- and flagella-associated protein 95 isoform X2 n=1 Tax=Pelodiscus sinensis TaxID=13735 RepID=UPI003F6C2ACB
MLVAPPPLPRSVSRYQGDEAAPAWECLPVARARGGHLFGTVSVRGGGSGRCSKSRSPRGGHLRMDMGPPDVLERKGTLTLRSRGLHYGRPTLVYRWHQNREAEPKDYDINEVPLGSKNLCQSTYSRFGTLDEAWITTYQDHLSQPYTNKEYREIEIRKSMLNEDNFEDGVLDREPGLPKTGIGAVLPRHPSDHFTMYLDTTYRIDYVPPYDYMPQFFSGSLESWFLVPWLRMHPRLKILH